METFFTKDKNFYKVFFRLMLVVALQNLVAYSVNMLDNMMLGSYDQNALSGAATVNQIFFVVNQLAIAIGNALIVMSSQYWGKKDTYAIRKLTGIVLIFSLLAAMLILVICSAFPEQLLGLFTTSPDIIMEGQTYLKILKWTFVLFLISNLLISMLRSVETVQISFVVSVISLIVNGGINYTLIFGHFGFPEMGIKGAAIATVLGQLLSTALGVYITRHKVKEIHTDFKHFHFDASLVKEMYKIAIPSMLMNSIMSIMTVFMNMILSGFSALSVSVYSIYFKLQQFLYMAVSGMSNAVIAIISYNYGARNKERIKSCIRISLISTIIIMISGTVIFQLFPVQLLSLFNASDEMLSIGIPALKTISLSFVFGGVNVQGCAILQSLDSSKESLVVTLLRQFIIILPLAFALSKMFGLNHVWFAFPVSELVALILCIRFLKEVDEDFIENLN